MIEWRPCPGFPDYEVSDKGDVRRSVERRNGPVGLVMSTYLDRDGYKRVHLRHRGDRKALRINRLVALAFIGEPPSPYHEAAHGDGIKSNNHFTNLRWATPVENRNDRVRHGTHNAGESHGKAKLTEDQVLEIRRLYQKGKRANQDLMAKFGVSREVIFDAAHGRSWKHLPRSVAEVTSG